MIKRKIANRLFNNLLAIVFLWCHQELYFIYKWLYIITFQKRKKGNLLLLLHLEFALFCASLHGGFLLQR